MNLGPIRRYWLVVYAYREKARTDWDGNVNEVQVSNVLLSGGHPVLWLSRQSPVFRERYVAWLLWFTEVDEATFDAAESEYYINVEIVDEG
jgi:hypothetical protein